MSLPANEKEALIVQRMDILGVRETDLEENPADLAIPNAQPAPNGVVLRHRPSGLFVKCQATPDQAQNRLIALRLLLDKVEPWQKKSRAERQTANRVISLLVAIAALTAAVTLYLIFRQQAFQP